MERGEATRSYARALQQALVDGGLSPIEAQNLYNLQIRLGLSDSDTYLLRVSAFVSFLDGAVMADTVEKAHPRLPGILKGLGLAGTGDPVLAAAVQRAILHLTKKVIQFGVLPTLDVGASRLAMIEGEVCHFELSASLLEERVINSGWEAGNSGFSFRVAKGVRFHVGGTKGRRVSEKAVVPVSTGTLSITNKRIVFLGVPKSFDFPWKRVLSVEPFTDGLQLYVSNRQKSPTLRYDEFGYGDIIASVCSQYLS